MEIGDLRTLQDIFPRFESFGDSTALIDFTGEERRELSFSDLCRESERIAAGLSERGVEPRERVALFGTNCTEWVLCRLALIRIDAVCVPVDFDADRDRLARLVDDSGARMLIVSPSLLETAREALEDLSRDIDTILLTSAGSRGKAAGDDGATDADGDDLPVLADLAADPTGAWPEAEADGIVSRFYTSGTTGRPKAVPLTHENILTNLRRLSALELASPRERILLPLPLHHSFPFIVGLLLPHLSGAPVVFPAGVTGPALLDAMKQAEVSVIVGVPRLYRAMLGGIENRMDEAGFPAAHVLRGLYALSRVLRERFGLRLGRTLLAPVHRRLAPQLHLLASGGARLDGDVARRLEGLGFQVLSGYGLVETTSVATFNRPDANRLGSAGKPPEGVEVRIAEVSETDDGEIQIRGPIVFEGYPDNPEANEESFTEDGWYRTGDLGHFDDDGYLYVTGRLKEIIVLSGGKNVEPESVEQVYADHRLIDEVAVLERDDRLVAIVVPDLEVAQELGTSDFESEIRVALQERGRKLPGYMRVADFVLTREELPKNHLGKYKRHQLDEFYERAERGEAAPEEEISEEDEERMSTERGARLIDWLQRRFPDRNIHPGTSLQMELGIDSLSWVDFGLDLERAVGVSLSEDDVAEVITVRDLLDVVEEAEGLDEEEAEERDREMRERQERDRKRWLGAPGASARAAGAVAFALNRLALRVFLRLRAEGVDKVPAEGPLIIVANHQSDVDPAVIAAVLPYRTMRAVWWGAERRRVFGAAIGRLLAPALHLFPVDERAPSASLNLAAEVLERERILVWFPESWRSPTGEIQKFRPGIGRLVEESGARVLPCRIEGTIDVMPRDARLPRPGAVTCRFGEPISAERLTSGSKEEGDARERHAAIAAQIRDAVAALDADTAERKEAG